jgi:hypothetical protein
VAAKKQSKEEEKKQAPRGRQITSAKREGVEKSAEDQESHLIKQGKRKKNKN